MSAQPQPSLYTRARTPPSPHPAPGNAGLVLLVMVLLAIVAAVAFVGPDVVRELRQVVYCMNHAQEAAC